jgi:hypothetical protein
MNCGGRFPELFFRCSKSKRSIDGVGKSSFGCLKTKMNLSIRNEKCFATTIVQYPKKMVPIPM